MGAQQLNADKQSRSNKSTKLLRNNQNDNVKANISAFNEDNICSSIILITGHTIIITFLSW